MVDPTRTAIVVTRSGFRYHVTFLNDLDQDVPYVNIQDYEVGGTIPVGVDESQLPADGETSVVLTRWTKNKVFGR